MTDFTPEEWGRIVSILRLQPNEEPRIRRTLLQMRAYAKDRAGIQAARRLAAKDRLEAARDALAQLVRALGSLEIDPADPGALPLALLALYDAGVPAEEVRRHARDAERLRVSMVAALHRLPVARSGAPTKARDQGTVIRDLARYFTRRTHRRATSTETRPFA
jgi:hypothetical protein